jgi:hypothetical protein
VFLFLCCILLAVLLLGALATFAIAFCRKDGGGGSRWQRARRDLGYFAATNSLRIVRTFFQLFWCLSVLDRIDIVRSARQMSSTWGAVTCFCFYQFRIGKVSGWAAILLAALTLFSTLVAISGLSWHVTRTARRKTPQNLYSDEKFSRQFATFVGSPPIFPRPKPFY